MRVRRVVATAVVVVAASVGFMAGTAAAGLRVGTSVGRADRVLVLSLPYLSWTDLEGRGDVPHLSHLLESSAVANLSVRAPGIHPDLAGGYATLSAGDKAVASGEAVDGAGFEASERVGAGTAGEIFARRTGVHVSGGLVHVGLPRIVDANAQTDYEAEVGVLGAALAGAGYARAVIGNADGVELLPAESDDTTSEASRPYRRAAVLGLMDGDGTVPAGRVSATLTMDDPRAPFGVRLDNDAVTRAFDEVWHSKTVVLVEASDLVRAGVYSDIVAPNQRAAVLTGALRATDALVGRLLTRVDRRRDAVVIVGPTASRAGGVLSIAAVRASGFGRGLLRSGTTQRSGYVQLMDIGPSVLDLAGVARPESMRGRPVELGERHGNADQRRAFLVDGNNAATFRVRIATSAPNLYVWLTSLLVVAMLVAFWRPRYRILRAMLPWAAFGLLGYLATVYLARLFPFHDVGILAYWMFVMGGAIALAVLFRVSGRGCDLEAVMGGLAFLVALLVADVVLGNPLQFNSALGFSPSVAGRFVGFGNSGYAVLASAALLLAALVAHRVGGRRGVWCAIGVLAVAFVADAAPFWGADVGGLLSMVPAYGITAVLLLGIRVRWRTVMVFVGAAVAALAAATVLDLQQSSGHRRHLGRLIEQIDAEGSSAFTDVIGRKISQNLTSLQSSSFRILVVIGAAFIAYLVLSRPPQFVRLLERVPELRAALIGFGVLAVLGYGFNDTGVAVPGLMIGVLVCSLVPLLCLGSAPARADVPADVAMTRA